MISYFELSLEEAENFSFELFIFEFKLLISV